MNSLFFTVLILFLLNGCASGKFSLYEGTAKFEIPLDWPGPQKKELTPQKDDIHVNLPE